jgi:hypothetical protein
MAVFKPLDLGRFLELLKVSEITPGVEIAKRIKTHRVFCLI